MGSFEIVADGRRICFLSKWGRDLFIGAAGEDGIVQSLHNLTNVGVTNELSLCGGEVWKRRGKTPLFERLALQFAEILNSGFVSLGQEGIDKVNSTLIEIAFDLSKAEEALINYHEIEKDAVLKCHEAGGINRQPSGISYQDPTLKLKGIAERILIRLVIALRKLPSVLTVLTGEQFPDGEKFMHKLSDSLPVDDPDRTVLAGDKKWIGELFFIRGTIEHDRWTVLPFQVFPSPGSSSGYEVQVCRVQVRSQGEAPVELASYLDVTFYNTFTFVEEAVALPLGDKINYPAALVSLAESERPKYRHFRYVLDVVPEIKAKFPKHEGKKGHSQT